MTSKIKLYFEEYIITRKIVYPISFVLFQLGVLYYFLLRTNEGKNDAETDGVIIALSLLVLLILMVPFAIIIKRIEPKINFIRINIFIISLIPVIWFILIYYFGNPLYRIYV